MYTHLLYSYFISDLIDFIPYIDSQIVVSSSKDTIELSLLDVSGFYCICGEHHIE